MYNKKSQAEYNKKINQNIGVKLTKQQFQILTDFCNSHNTTKNKYIIELLTSELAKHGIDFAKAGARKKELQKQAEQNS